MEALGQCLRVQYDLMLIRLKLVGQRLAQTNRLARDHVLQRAALSAGEYGLVDGLGILCLAQYHAAARAAQRLVRGGGNYVGIRHGGGMLARRDQTRDVRHVHHQQRAALVGDFAELLKIDYARVCARARDYQLRLFLQRQFAQRVVIDGFVAFAHAIGYYVKVFARHVDGTAVRQMPAVAQVHAQYRVARLQQREVYRKVGLCARVRLYIGMIRAEQLARALARQIFHYVHVLAAAIVALARIALGILVG